MSDMISTTLTYISSHRTDILWKIILSIVIIFIWYKIIKFINKKIQQHIENTTLQSDTYTNNISHFATKISTIILSIFLVLIICEVIGIKTAIIMWWISLSLWFAMETTIGNMIAGIMIMTNKKIKIGDFVQFMGKLNLRGTIEEINIP